MLQYRRKISTRFTLLLAAVFVIGIVLSGAALYSELQAIGEQWVSSNSLQLLHTMNAVRTYTNTHIDPLLAPLMAGQNTFVSQSVPAFSARSVFDMLRGQTPYQNLFYKEAAVNPTAAQDRADPWEAQLLDYLRSNPKVSETSGFRVLNGQPVYYDAR